MSPTRVAKARPRTSLACVVVALAASVFAPVVLLDEPASARLAATTRVFSSDGPVDRPGDGPGDGPGQGAADGVSKSGLRNHSFDHGTRHWAVRGRGARMRPVVAGHHSERAVALTGARTGTVVMRALSSRSTPASGGVRAVAWMRNPGRALDVTLKITVNRGRKAARTLASRSFVVDWKRWRRVQATVTEGLPANSQVSVSILTPGRGGHTPLVVDDVKLVAVTGKTSQPSGGRRWASGVSGSGAADGAFAQWRGSPVDIAGTWNDDFEAQQHQWSVLPDAEYGAWQGDLDVAVGGIYPSQGDSWAAAAAGAYDERWAASLRTLAASRAGHEGTVYIRFAHEFNGDWFEWSVTGDQAEAFKAAWRRFRALQLEIMPRAKLVFCPNSETRSSLGLDWRDAFPGRAYVDVMAVDFYNQYPFVGNGRDFASNLGDVDSTGAPRGLDAHREFAERRGLPFAVAEWSSNADMGDAAGFMNAFHTWLQLHQGSGPGQVLYEIVFNVSGFDSGQFEIAPETHQPRAAATYRDLW